MSQFGRNVEQDARMEKHKFSPAILSQVRQYGRPNNYRGILEVAEDWFVIGLVSYLSIACWLHWFPLAMMNPTPQQVMHGLINMIAYVFAVFVIGTRHRSLADCLHQASHSCLANNWVLNFLLGTVFSGYAVLQSFSVYHNSHVREHHYWLGNPWRDPDYMGLIDNKICGVNRTSHRVKQYMAELFTVKCSVNYLRYLAKHRIINDNENKYERFGRIAYWCFVLAAVWRLQWFTYFLLFWVVPFLTTNVWVGAFLELLEHYPMIDGAQPFVDIMLTKNRVGNFYTNWLLGIHWEGYHLVHHLFPKIPSWNYKAVHQTLMQDPTYAKLDHGDAGWRHMVWTAVNDADTPSVKDKRKKKKKEEETLQEWDRSKKFS